MNKIKEIIISDQIMDMKKEKRFNKREGEFLFLQIKGIHEVETGKINSNNGKEIRNYNFDFALNSNNEHEIVSGNRKNEDEIIEKIKNELNDIYKDLFLYFKENIRYFSEMNIGHEYKFKIDRNNSKKGEVKTITVRNTENGEKIIFKVIFGQGIEKSIKLIKKIEDNFGEEVKLEMIITKMNSLEFKEIEKKVTHDKRIRLKLITENIF